LNPGTRQESLSLTATLFSISYMIWELQALLAGDFGNRWTSGYDDPTEGSENWLFSLRAKNSPRQTFNFQAVVGSGSTGVSAQPRFWGY
jgi:hypothetical protein